ncbi:MAG TPA: DNA/RNA non-specific endonuclease [Arachnia sp.]|nr:DNA/RNA non-specific endonuclease [Arachnia sp.]HMT85295.1 DNA/RNA non-specific endonuclease [Arachnia sp.]
MTGYAEPARATDSSQERVPAPSIPATDTGTPAGAALGLMDNGDFVATLGGTTWRLTAQEIAAGQLDLTTRPQPLPGIQLRSASLNTAKRALTVKAGIAVKGVADGDLTLTIDAKGTLRISGQLVRSFSLPALGTAQFTLRLDEGGTVGGTAEIPAAKLVPAGSGIEATGSGRVDLAAGRLSGGGKITVSYRDLGAGQVEFSFDGAGAFAAKGDLTITPPFLEPVTASVSVDPAGNLAAHTETTLGGGPTRIPNLAVTGGSLVVDYLNGMPALTVGGFGATYAGFGSLSLASLTLDKSLTPTGSGSLSADIPGLDTANGELAVKRGKVSGQVTLGKDQFPSGLPITSGTITARLAEDGSLSFSGGVVASLGPAGTATIEAAYGTEGFALSGTVELTIPGLGPVRVAMRYADGDLSGSATAPVNPDLLPGLSGDVSVRFEHGLWGGETTLSYSADDGKLSGTVKVTIQQGDAGDIRLGGEGQVTAQLMPGIQGTLTAKILPEGGVDVSGEILVTEPYELFAEQRLDKELFRYSQNIPLWGILVAVIRVAAGVRAGIGPGVFRNIKVTGSYTVGSAKTDPSFSVEGELYIPAFVEGYVSFGAGIGVDVLLGSLTGGIEGVATAGLYGAVSVVPELSYENGDWSVDGTATLAAGARLTLGLNAWAEVKALWMTVWERTWKLAEFVMPIGQDLALQAKMHYTFGKPEAPTLDFTTTDIDSAALIQSAMPKDAPPGSGARDALKNEAQWKGALKAQREAPVPPKPAGAGGQAPPPAPPKPAGSAAPGGGPAAAPPEAKELGEGAKPPGTSENADAVKDAATPDSAAAEKVPDGALPEATTERYPTGISLAMLDEPPVPAARTAEQENQDVQAAAKVVGLATAQAQDSDALDDYFPRIKERFRLTSIGYEGDIDKGFGVVIKINPVTELSLEEPLAGTGWPANAKLATRVLPPKTSTIAGHTVGVGYTVAPLGPDHGAGTPPKDQQALLDLLPTAGTGEGAGQVSYVRGHLLNDNLGGPGVASNLFPITQAANSQHLASIESDVKKWVNERKLWVRYDVEIVNPKDKVKQGRAPSKNSVDATIVATAWVLNTDLSKNAAYARQVKVTSHFDAPSTTDPDVPPEQGSLAAVAAMEARPEDDALQINLSTGAAEAPKLTEEMVGDLKKAITAMGREEVSKKLRGAKDVGEEGGVKGIGEERLKALWEAFDAQRGGQQVDFSGKDKTWRSNLSVVIGKWEKIREVL